MGIWPWTWGKKKEAIQPKTKAEIRKQEVAETAYKRIHAQLLNLEKKT